MGPPDRRWDEMAGEVAYALAFDLHTSLAYFDEDAVLMPVDALDDDPTRVDVRKRFLRVFDAERDFVRRVWAALEPLLAQRPLVVLFDIDQTLGSRKGRPGESATLIRPAAPPLLRQLRGAGLSVGILTTRGITEVRSNLADAMHLGGLARYLDEAHVTAAEMPEHADAAVAVSSDEVPASAFSRFGHLLRPPHDELEVFRGVRDPRGRPLPAKDLNKLLQLAAIRARHPDTCFAVVDDRDYADLLAGPDAGVVGIHLADHERAHY